VPRPILGGFINECQRATQEPKSKPVAKLWHGTRH